MVYGEEEDSTRDASGVLWFKVRIYVPQVGDLIPDVLFKAHGLHYSNKLVQQKCT